MKLLRLTGSLLAAGLALTGCGDAAGSSPVPATTSTGTPTPTSRATPLAVPAAGAGSDGLTVRYAGADGSIKTLRVEDFHR